MLVPQLLKSDFQGLKKYLKMMNFKLYAMKTMSDSTRAWETIIGYSGCNFKSIACSRKDSEGRKMGSPFANRRKQKSKSQYLLKFAFSLQEKEFFVQSHYWG